MTIFKVGDKGVTSEGTEYEVVYVDEQVDPAKGCVVARVRKPQGYALFSFDLMGRSRFKTRFLQPPKARDIDWLRTVAEKVVDAFADTDVSMEQAAALDVLDSVFNKERKAYVNIYPGGTATHHDTAADARKSAECDFFNRHGASHIAVPVTLPRGET